jgi:hypothetical protein
MSESFEHIERIEAYIENRLNGEELQQFLDELNTNEALRQDLEFHRLIHDSIAEAGAQDLKQDLQDIHQDLFKNGVKSSGGNSLKYGLIVGGAITVGALVYLNMNDDPELPVQTVVEEKVIQVEEPKEKPVKTKELIAIPEEDIEKKEQPIEKPSKSLKVPVSNPEAGTITAMVDDERVAGYDKNIVPRLIPSSDLVKGNGYLFDGKELLFYNLDVSKAQEMRIEKVNGKLKYVIYNNKLYELKKNSKPSPLIEVKDDDVLFLYGM